MPTPRITPTKCLGKPVNHPFSHTCGVALQMSLFPVYSGCENYRLNYRSTLEEDPSYSYTNTLHIIIGKCIYSRMFRGRGRDYTYNTHWTLQIRIHTHKLIDGFKAKLNSVKAVLRGAGVWVARGQARPRCYPGMGPPLKPTLVLV